VEIFDLEKTDKKLNEAAEFLKTLGKEGKKITVAEDGSAAPAAAPPEEAPAPAAGGQ